MKRISFIIISIVAIGLFLIRIKPKINSFVSAFDKDGYVTFSGNGMNFLFDTGANITLLYADTVPESFYPFMQADAKDIAGNDFSVKKYFSFYTCLGNIEGNLWTVILLPRRFQWQHIHGVIGTDMIDRCNWGCLILKKVQSLMFIRLFPELRIWSCAIRKNEACIMWRKWN